jgi:hypothetical protein
MPDKAARILMQRGPIDGSANINSNRYTDLNAQFFNLTVEAPSLMDRGFSDKPDPHVGFNENPIQTRISKPKSEAHKPLHTS